MRFRSQVRLGIGNTFCREHILSGIYSTESRPRSIEGNQHVLGTHSIGTPSTGNIHIEGNQYVLGTHSTGNTFYREHILQGTHSQKSRPRSIEGNQYVLGTHSIGTPSTGSTFSKEQTSEHRGKPVHVIRPHGVEGDVTERELARFHLFCLPRLALCVYVCVFVCLFVCLCV